MVIEKLIFSKNVNNKRCAPKLVFFNEKKMKGGQKMSQGRNYFRTRFVQTFQGHNAKFFEFHNT